MHTFLLADRQYLTRAGLRHLVFKEHPQAEVFEAPSIRQLRQLLENWSQAVVLIDMSMFADLYFTDITDLARQYPKTFWISVETTFNDHWAQQLRAEPRFSLLLKTSDEIELSAAIRYATQGERFIAHDITHLLLSRETPTGEAHHEGLTEAEQEVLRYIALGKSTKEIADLRHTSTHTVITHKKNLFRKLKVSSIHEATRYALREGWVEMVEYYI